MFLSQLFNKIKSYIILLIFALFFATTTFSQGEVSVGLKFGYGLSRCFFTVDPIFVQQTIEQDFLPVYEGGLVLNHFNHNNLGMQLEILYAQKGWQEKFDNSATRTVLINYLEIPFISEYRLRQRKNYIMFKLGTYGAYAFDAEIAIEGETETSAINYEQFLYGTFDFGFKGGVGYELKMGNNGVQLMVTFSQSFWNVIKRDREGIYRSLTQGLYVSCIYSFSFTRKSNSRNKVIKVKTE